MNALHTVDQVEATLRELQASQFPETLVVLGSGWNRMLDEAEVRSQWSFQEVFGAGAGVPGHDGQLVVASVKNDQGTAREAVFMKGRFHTYEGYSTEEVTRPLQALARVGVKRVILTAAAGGLNPDYQVGDFVVLTDIISAFCPSPLTGPAFQDLSQVFAPEWRNQALTACQTKNISTREGVYCFTRGPHYESPADKRLFRTLGADVIGMSLVPETIMARRLGLQVLGLAFVTNLAFVTHSHQEVVAAAEHGSQQMVTLLKYCL